VIYLVVAQGGVGAAVPAFLFFGLTLPPLIATVLLSVCRVRGREVVQWVTLCSGSTVGTIGVAFYGATQGDWTIDIVTMALEVGFGGLLTGGLALPIATWLGDKQLSQLRQGAKVVQHGVEQRVEADEARDP
jgi:hypothetical protein